MIVYPMVWPAERSKVGGLARVIAPNPKTLQPSVATLNKTLASLGATNVRIETNVPVDAAGRRFLGAFTTAHENPGIVVGFKIGAKAYLFTADLFTKVADNAHAVVRQIESLKALAKYADREAAAACWRLFERVEAS